MSEFAEGFKLVTRFEMYTRPPKHLRESLGYGFTSLRSDQWTLRLSTHNLLTNAGLIRMARTWRKYTGGPYGPNSIAIGIGQGNAPDVTDTALDAEVIRKTLDFSTLDISHPVNTATTVFQVILGTAEPTIQDPAGVLLSEAGLYSGEGTPVLISRVLLPVPLLKYPDLG